MAVIIHTDRLVQVRDDTAAYEGKVLDPLTQKSVYCGLDSMVTLEVFEKIKPQLDPTTQIIYDFERALQAPVLEMMARGIATDPFEAGMMLGKYRARRRRIVTILDRLATAVWGRGLNPNSPKQLKEFFYGYMGVPEQYIYEKGTKKVSTNRECLERVQYYRYSRPIAAAVLAAREYAGKIAVLQSGIDPDGRMRFSYNITGTNTGRFSCNSNVFGGGTNGNNITDELRRIFIASEGKKLAYLDLEQAESRVTAYLAGDEAYIEACESADLHVSVARMIWPELNWVDEVPPGSSKTVDEINREVADTKFYRHWSYRDLSKRGGHLTNYVGQPLSNAHKLKISVEVMKHFNRTYLSRFRGISRMHGDVARELQVESQITTPLGRKRHFFGRGYDDSIIRKGVAYGPQSTIGDLLNLGMWRIWRYMPDAALLTQLYDAVLFEYEDASENFEREVIGMALDFMTIEVEVTDTKFKNKETRTMIVPVEATVGWNWGKYHPKKNPDGMKAYKGEDTRKRRSSASTDLLKRVMS